MSFKILLPFKHNYYYAIHKKWFTPHVFAVLPCQGRAEQKQKRYYLHDPDSYQLKFKNINNDALNNLVNNIFCLGPNVHITF